ncbi:hypothetical protein ACFWP0_05330 [Achromobacter sp. NPDC058515]|uniref:hypothetical protein n=1 Tax=Achromobacter sp. NPDC058515 TaxID=3346533 RepID=UPI0036672279
MADDALTASYHALARDSSSGALPQPQRTCTECTVPGPIFSLNPDGGARDADLELGIPSGGEAATYEWFTNNPWIRDKEKNYRDTFLMRVLHRFGEDQGEARLAELYAFLAVQEYEIACLDDGIAEDTLTPLMLKDLGDRRRASDWRVFDMHRNFVFARGKLYYLTFESVKYTRVSTLGHDEDNNTISMYAWDRPTGLFSVEKAAKQLAENFQRAKTNVRIWEIIKDLFLVATAVLSFIPAVSAARGVVAAVRYTLVAVDRALAMDALVDGTSRMITGEGLSIGEQFFESLAALKDPKNAEERGKQVFMGINLAMLTPTLFGTARWVFRRIRGRGAVPLDTAKLDEEDLRRIAGNRQGEPMALETVVKVEDHGQDGSKISVRERHSPDTNKSQVVVEADTGRADFAVIADSLRQRIAWQIQLLADARKGRGLRNVLGDAGEEIFAAGMVKHWGVRPENILGYNINPRGISRFGLKNKSGHGLDVLLRVPPPPEMEIRVPTEDARHYIDGVHGEASQTRVLRFTDETLLVVEVKATMGRERTPGFYAGTQGQGGERNTKRVADLAQRNRGIWSPANVPDPDAGRKLAAIRAARASGNIEYMHVQVFLNNEGKINPLAGRGVGQGSGIQLNDWPGTNKNAD